MPKLTNVTDELRKMAADKTQDTDAVVRQSAALIADISDTQNEQGDAIAEQGKAITAVNNKVDSNTKFIGWYNTGLKMIGGTIGLWLITEMMVRLFGNGKTLLELVGQ